MTGVAAYNTNDPYEQLIAQIIQIERQPQSVLRQRRSAQTVVKAVLSDFDTTLSALNSTLERLTDQFSSPFSARAATVPEEAGFGVTITDEAPPGAHSLRVDRLASTDTRLSRRFDRDGATLRSFFDTNGPQTFTIEVFSPTDEEPERRVGIEVTAAPDGTTDADILANVRTAIRDAMDAAVTDGTIRAVDKPSASTVKETSDSARLTLRSGGTGYASRLAFTDSADGLLGLLQLDRDALANTASTGPTTTTTPATGASYAGAAVAVPATIDALNSGLDITIGGTARSVDLAAGTYTTADELAAALGDALGDDVTVDVVDGALRVTTAATGATSSLQITGGSALDALGFEVMATPAAGTDETTTTETTTISAEESGGQVQAVGTSETTSALNSVIHLDGLTLYRSTNEVDDALDGVSLSLDAVGETTTFRIGPDGESIVKEVKSFIDKYNAVLGFISRKSNLDPEAGARGDFAGDVSISSLRFGMRNDAIRTVNAGPDAPARFSDLGIEIGDDGKLKLADSDALLAAVEANPNAVQSFFGAEDGMAERLTSRLDTFLGSDGILKRRSKTIDDKIKRMDAQIGRWDERLAMREDQLRTQYAQLQETLATLQGQQSSIYSFFYGG